MDYKFDLDINVKKQQKEIVTHVVVMKKLNKSNGCGYFHITKLKEFGNIFHMIGFWNKEIDLISSEELNNFDIEEVWVPREEVHYMKSMIYKKK